MIKKQYRLKKDLRFCGNCNKLIESGSLAMKGTLVNVGNLHPYNPTLIEAYGQYIPVEYLEEVKE